MGSEMCIRDRSLCHLTNCRSRNRYGGCNYEQQQAWTLRAGWGSGYDAEHAHRHTPSQTHKHTNTHAHAHEYSWRRWIGGGGRRSWREREYCCRCACVKDPLFVQVVCDARANTRTHTCTHTRAYTRTHTYTQARAAGQRALRPSSAFQRCTKGHGVRTVIDLVAAATADVRKIRRAGTTTGPSTRCSPP